jgi:hypothetical protein
MRHGMEIHLKYATNTFLCQWRHVLHTRRDQEVVEKTRKLAISIRMHAGDVRKVKRLAQRLGARDSEVIRFAVKTMLARLAPLYDSDVQGKNLVPVFVESGSELLSFFELDAVRLEAIINSEVDDSRRVDSDDIALIALTSAPQPYAALKLSEMNHKELRSGDPLVLARSMREYLYEKYVFRSLLDEPHAVERVLGVAGVQQ